MECPLLHTEPDVCDWCGKTLTGRHTRWCGRKCSRLFRANHRWTQAKDLLRKEEALYECWSCGQVFNWADIDVDHVEPCLGKHGTFGCHHHQTNLRIVCKPCHKAITASQHREGVFKK